MPDHLSKQTSCSLKRFNTFGVDYLCDDLQLIEKKIELDELRKKTDMPLLILGGGSNVLFTENFKGTVAVINSKGIKVTQDNNFYYLTVAAGEDWHSLVKFSLVNNMPGLENLALIPGTVGAAPIQNIGAYGTEFCDVCHWVTYSDLITSKSVTLSADKCLFGYRESIFKAQLKDSAVITSVGIKLAKNWRPNLSYGPLHHFDPQKVSATDIFNLVCQLREQKLPNPKVLGNAGSFFKNPIVEASVFMTLAQKYPNIVGYALADGRMKLAAAWLIEQAGLKGFILGKAGVHQEQALVLVNLSGASGTDIAKLAIHIIDVVNNQFSVVLEPEPRIIGKYGEVTLNDVIAKGV